MFSYISNHVGFVFKLDFFSEDLDLWKTHYTIDFRIFFTVIGTQNVINVA